MVLPLPTILDIEPTTFCDYDCIMCQRSYWHHSPKNMTLDEFIYIYSKFPKITILKLQGMGEPFLNSDLARMVEFAKNKGTFVYTYSNGSFLSTQDKWDTIINSGINLIRISIDGGTRNAYKMIHGKDNFQVIINNFPIFISRLKKDSPEIELWVTLIKENMNEIDKIVDIAANNGIKIVNLQIIPNTFSYKNEINQKIADHVVLKNTEILSVIKKTKQYTKNKGITLKIQFSKVHSEREKCHWPYDRMFINVKGDVIPCCSIADSSTINMGNIFTSSISQIWGSSLYNNLRNSLSSNLIPFYCQDCYSKKNDSLVQLLRGNQVNEN